MGIRIYIVLTLVCSALAFMRAMRSNRVLSPRSFLGDKSKTNARIVFGPGPMGSHLLHGSVALSMVDDNSADEDKVNVPVSDEVDPYKSVKEYYQNNELNMQELSTQTNEYPMNPLDAYPEDINSNDDEAVLDAMRQERQISNDLWQSTLFRDTQCKDGDWSGSYEMYCTSVGTKSDESEDDSGINLRVCDKGTVFTKMSASEFSMQGVSITASEQYTSSRPEGAKLHPSSEQALQDHGPLLLKQTRSEVGPTQWRTEAGNQVSLEEFWRSYRGCYYSILVVSCFSGSDALDSSGILLSYCLISLASPIAIILISTLKHTYLYLCRLWGRVSP